MIPLGIQNGDICPANGDDLEDPDAVFTAGCDPTNTGDDCDDSMGSMDSVDVNFPCGQFDPSSDSSTTTVSSILSASSDTSVSLADGVVVKPIDPDSMSDATIESVNGRPTGKPDDYDDCLFPPCKKPRLSSGSDTDYTVDTTGTGSVLFKPSSPSSSDTVSTAKSDFTWEWTPPATPAPPTPPPDSSESESEGSVATPDPPGPDDIVKQEVLTGGEVKVTYGDGRVVITWDGGDGGYSKTKYPDGVVVIEKADGSWVSVQYPNGDSTVESVGNYKYRIVGGVAVWVYGEPVPSESEESESESEESERPPTPPVGDNPLPPVGDNPVFKPVPGECDMDAALLAFDHVNEYRVSKSLQPLQWNDALYEAAKWQALNGNRYQVVYGDVATTYHPDTPAGISYGLSHTDSVYSDWFTRVKEISGYQAMVWENVGGIKASEKTTPLTPREQVDRWIASNAEKKRPDGKPQGPINHNDNMLVGYRQADRPGTYRKGPGIKSGAVAYCDGYYVFLGGES